MTEIILTVTGGYGLTFEENHVHESRELFDRLLAVARSAHIRQERLSPSWRFRQLLQGCE